MVLGHCWSSSQQERLLHGLGKSEGNLSPGVFVPSISFTSSEPLDAASTTCSGNYFLKLTLAHFTPTSSSHP